MNAETHFCEVVKSDFIFLVQEHAFRICQELSDKQIEFVEFKSDQVYVRVTCTGPDFEPKMSFGLNGTYSLEDEVSYDWVDLQELDCCKSWTWKSNPEKPYDGRVSELARLLKDCGRNCLRGDHAVYVLMAKRREELRALHIAEENFIRAKVDADLAWCEKRYNDYINSLAGFQKMLNPIDIKRYNYAEKHKTA